MDEELYNKKAIDNVKTPDDLNDYLKVANPSVWLILSAVIILLIGVIIWGIYGKMYVTISVPTYVEKGVGISIVGENKINSIQEGMPIKIDTVNGFIDGKGYTKTKVTDIARDYGIPNLDYTPEDFAYAVTSKVDIGDGLYNAEIAIEEIRPVSFIFN